MQNLNLSVIIPTYNRKDVLKHVILSLINQKISSYEVIVCDDGSNDGTEKLVSNLKNDFTFPFELRYFFQEKYGFCAAKARNMGIKNSKAEKIVFIDQDIVVAPNMLCELQKVNEKEILYGKLFAVPYEFYRQKINDDIILKNFEVFDTQYHGPFKATLSSFGVVYKKNLDLVEAFDEDFIEYGFEDTELMCRLNDIGIKSKFVSTFSAYHIGHDYEKLIASKSMRDRHRHKRNNSKHNGVKVPI